NSRNLGSACLFWLYSQAWAYSSQRLVFSASWPTSFLCELTKSESVLPSARKLPIFVGWFSATECGWLPRELLLVLCFFWVWQSSSIASSGVFHPAIPLALLRLFLFSLLQLCARASFQRGRQRGSIR